MSKADIFNFLEFFYMMLVFGIAPGPDLLAVMQTALRDGYKRALQVTIGICVSGAVWGIFAAIGLAALMAKSPLAFNLLKWGGGAYLCYLGLQSLYTAFFKQDAASLQKVKEELQASSTSLTAKKALIKGFTTDFLSPDTAFFIVSFYPQFIPKNMEITSSLTILTLLQILSILLIFIPLSYASAKGAKFLSHPRILQSIDILSGLFFIWLALQLLLKHHP